MRIESTKGDDEYKCWLSPEEYEALQTVAAKDRSQKHNVVVLLGARVGLRAEEMTWITPNDVKRTVDGNYLLHVQGKDTSGEHGKKERDAYLPDVVERQLYELQRENGIDDNEPYLDVTQTRIRQIVHEVAEEVAEAIERYEDPDTPIDAGYDLPGRPSDWRKVSSHDLRRFWAQDCLRRRDMDPQIIMSVGGWDDFSSLKPYLHAPTEENIVNEFEQKFS